MEIDVVFAADRAYLPHFATAASSLVWNCSVQRIFLISDTADERVSQTLEAVADSAGKRAPELVVFEPPAETAGYSVSGHISAAAFWRIHLAELLPRDVQYALYLDSDLVITGDLITRCAEELSAPGENNPLVWAVEESSSHSLEKFGLEQGSYFNSGVLLLNMARWRDEAFGERLELLNQKVGGQLDWWDQDLLNIAINHDWQEFGHWANGILGKRAPDNLVVHFNGRDKPWHLGSSDPDAALYFFYRKKTLFWPMKKELSLSTFLVRLLPNWLNTLIKRTKRAVSNIRHST